MDYEKAYKDALDRAKDCHVNKKFSELDDNAQELCEYIFPELKVNDEMIREELINFIKKEANSATLNANRMKFKSMVAWLEKQDTKKFEEELDKAYKCADEVQYRKGYEDAKRELEKQGDTNETINRDKFAQNVLKGAAINLITWIDYNAAEGNMCLSNMECEDIEDALVSGNWDKIYAYIKKKLEKQGEQKPAWSEEDEIALGDALWCCKQAASIAKDENDMGNVWYAETWLKSIKDRVQPQQKQQWIDEAMKVICNGCAQKAECEFNNWKTCSTKDELIKAMEE